MIKDVWGGGQKDKNDSSHTQKRIPRESSKSNWYFDKTLGVLQNVRSEYGKEIRKDYESGRLNISRHDFLEHRIREDGVINTLSTVLKDNYLTIKVKEATKQGYAIARGGEIQ